jgi:hypothetical protein
MSLITKEQLNNNINLITKEQLSELSHKDQVRFALFCAYQVKNEWEKEPTFIKAIELVEMWLENKATIKECYDFARNTNNIINNLLELKDQSHFIEENFYYSLLVADYAIYAAGCEGNNSTWANPARSAHNSGYYAYIVDTTLVYAQITYYNELRYIDENFQRIVLEGE